MKYIKLFENFNRQPLYHYTSSLFEIMKSDTLLSYKPKYDKSNKNSISFTRDINSKLKNCCGYRLVFNQDKMRKAGYITKPIDEGGLTNNYVPYKQKEERLYQSIKNVGNYIEYIDFLIIEDSTSYSNLFAKKIFDELNIEGLDVDFYEYFEEYYTENNEILSNYIKKYPHIVLRKMNSSRK